MNLNKVSFYGQVQGGELTHDTWDQIELFLSTLEGNVRIMIEKAKKFRSHEQNKLYWRILTIIAHETGHTTDELHEAFKLMFLPRESVKLGKKTIEIAGSTTDLSTAEFNEYIARITAKASEMNIVVILPGEIPLSAYSE